MPLRTSRRRQWRVGYRIVENFSRAYGTGTILALDSALVDSVNGSVIGMGGGDTGDTQTRVTRDRLGCRAPERWDFLSFWVGFPIRYVSYCILMYPMCIVSVSRCISNIS